MLDDDEIKIIISVMMRAQISGQESIPVANTLIKLRNMLNDGQRPSEQSPAGASEDDSRCNDDLAL